MKTLRLAPPLLAAVAMLAVLSCGEGTNPVGLSATQTTRDEYHTIYGYTYENTPPYDFLPDVEVNWYCDTCDMWLGADAADDYARYDIYTANPWTSHNGHLLHGIAGKEGYDDDHRYIPDFRWPGIPYQVDFYLSETRK